MGFQDHAGRRAIHFKNASNGVFMAHENEKIKARLTALAQLVFMLGKYEGITETKELAVATRYDKRQIRRAKEELARANTSGQIRPGRANTTAQSGHIDPSPRANTTAPRANTTAPRANTTALAKENSPHTPLKENIYINNNNNNYFSDSYSESRCYVDDHGNLKLIGEERDYWVGRFGSEEALKAELLSANGYIQPNGSRSLILQVRARLGRQLQWKLDRDEKASAVEEKKSNRRARYEEAMRIAGKV